MNENRKVVGYFMDGGETTGGITEFLRTLLTNIDRKKFMPIGIFVGPGDCVTDIGPLFEKKIILNKGRLVNYKNSSNRIKKINANVTKVGLVIKSILKLTALIKTEKIDVIHVNYYPHHFIAGIAGKLTKTPVIWHWHSAKSYTKSTTKLLQFGLAHLCHQLVCCSRFVFDGMKQMKPNSLIIYNPIDAEQIRSAQVKGALKARIGHTENKLIIAIVGTISRIKGQTQFIEAANLVLNKYAECLFLIIGSETEAHQVRFNLTERLRSRIKVLNRSQSILFLGEIPQFSHFLGDVDILCMPTIPLDAVRGEAFPYSTLEAMSLGIPVVIHNVGGFNEVITNGVNGAIADCSDPSKLADAIIQLIKEKERWEEMGSFSQNLINKQFEAKKIIDSFHALYSGLTKAKLSAS
ncbi:MAG: glycosyltransferase family 4 protein [Bacteroidetes bacterium]|nr:glycosyltransferase family 4 protein [Bacteroidota bacterium]